MSYSSLWTINNEFDGKEEEVFQNSWLFAPIVMDALYYKYLPNKATFTKEGEKSGFILDNMHDNSLWNELRDSIFNKENTIDCMMWNIIVESIFFTQNKNFVADSIEKFKNDNVDYFSSRGELVLERFEEVISSIRNIGEENLAFAFKCTSCDDGVENWFEIWDDDKDDCIDITLDKQDTVVASFVFIENNKIKGYVTNLMFFEKKEFYLEELKKMN